MHAIEEDIEYQDGLDEAIDEEGDDFEYAAVDVPSDEEEEETEETFQDALRTVQLQKDKEAPPQVKPVVTRLPEVIDDFVRNFLVKANLNRTLECFETEWYEKQPQISENGKGLDTLIVPDVYRQNAKTMEELAVAKEEMRRALEVAEKAKAAWEHLKKDRDFHRASHRRVVQEKAKLITDLKRLQAQCAKYEPIIVELRQKYESCQKEKMLLRLDRDKLNVKAQGLETTLKERDTAKPDTAAAAAAAATAKKEASTRKGYGDTPWPSEDRVNPFKGVTFKPPNNITSWSSRKNNKAHSMSISSIALHPKTSSVVTGSDDKTWKLWNTSGELVMSGDDHKDWIASVDFHPRGTHLVTASGDKTVKVWDFLKAKCVATYKDHAQGVWRASFHDTGDFIASSSLDHTARIWDVQTSRCRSTLRGHVDSVNGLAWLPYSNILATCSGDKTVSLWDTRTAYCSHTFYGHENACNSVAFTPGGETMFSTDADGKVYVWDVREVRVTKVIECGPHPANGLCVDRSSTYLAVASDDCTIKLCNIVEGTAPHSLRGHEDAVLGVQFDAVGQFLVSCSADTTWRQWS